MHGAPALDQLLSNFVLLLVASVLVIFLSHRLRLSVVVGLLLTGVLIGPSALALVEREDVEIFAELGVVLLLFTVGLEVSLVRLRRNWRPFFVGGGLQMALTVAAVMAVASLWGVPPPQALFLGFLAALSSTAIVLKTYVDRQELNAPQGTLSAGILLFQDFSLAPLILLVPVLAGTTESSAGAIVGRLALGSLVVFAALILARRVVPRLLHWIVGMRVREVLVLGALAACFGIALFTYELGFSFALGAFLAGLVISESDYSHQVVAEILPFRDVFNSLFFVSVGMLLDFQQLAAHWKLALALVSLLLVGKALIVFYVVNHLVSSVRIAVIVALSLAQIGEFSFVLGGVGRQQGLLSEALYQAFLAAAIFTMGLTPLLIQIAPRVAAAVTRVPFPTGLRRIALGARSTRSAGEELPELHEHVIVVGYGTNGRNLARVLNETAIPLIVVELDRNLVQRAREAGVPALYGDATREEIQRAAGVERASLLVVAVSDLAATRQALRLARAANPELTILVRTRAVREVDELYDLGADEVIPEEFETSVEIFSRVLDHYHVPRNIIQAQVRIIRDEGYEVFRRGPDTTQESLRRIAAILEETLTETFLLEPDSSATGRTLRELDLRRASGGASVIAVVRSGRPQTNPSPDVSLSAGDTLVLVGNHAALEKAVSLLQGREEGASHSSPDPVAGSTLDGEPDS